MISPVYVLVVVLITESNQSQTAEDIYANIMPSPKQKANTMENCSLTLKEVSSEDGNEVIEDNRRLVRYDLKMSDDLDISLTNKTGLSTLFQPFKFFLVRDATGKLLLELKDAFEPMSLYILGPSVASKTVSVIEEHLQCLNKASAEDLENVIISLMLPNVENSTSLPSGSVELCHQRVSVRDNDEGRVKFVCCKIDSNHELICETLKDNLPLYFLFAITFIISTLFSIYSPLFVFRQICTYNKYVTTVHKPENQMKLNVLTVDSSLKPTAEEYVRVKSVTSASFKHLKKEMVHLKRGISYVLKASKVHLRIRSDKLMRPGDSPVSLTEFISGCFLRCKAGGDLSETRACCRENMLKLTPCCDISWYSCFRTIVILLGAMLMVCPWLLRIWFYYRFEEDGREKLHHKLDLLNVKPTYQGSLVLYFTPVHNFFITIYCIIPATLNMYIALPKVLKKRFRSVVQDCFNKMSKTKTSDAFCTFFAHMIWPLTEFGIVGVLVMPLWLLVLPLQLTFLLYRIVPLFNVFCRLAVNSIVCAAETFCSKRTKCSRSNSVFVNFIECTRKVTEDMRVQGVDIFSRKQNAVLSLVLTLASLALLSTVVLLFECVTFYMECLLYIGVGVILHGVVYFKFLVLFGFFVWYAYDCFREVGVNFKSFSDALSVEVHKHLKLNTKSPTNDKTSDDITITPQLAMNNTNHNTPGANAINLEHALDNTERNHVTTDSDGSLKWIVNYPLFFFDTLSAIYLSKDFILRVASYKYFGTYSSPGPVHIAYLRAFVHLMYSTLVLSGVLLLILATDDSKNTYALQLTVFSVIGGLLPGLAKIYFMKSKSVLSTHQRHLTFQKSISTVLHDYSESWDIDDIEIETIIHADDNRINQISDVQKAACGVSSDNGYYLEHQISDFCESKPTHPTDHTENVHEQASVLLVSNPCVPKDTDIIAVLNSNDPLNEEIVDILYTKQRMI